MRLACFDPDIGQEVGDHTEMSRALAESERLRAEESPARAGAERRARVEAEARAKLGARIRELEAKRDGARRRKPR